MKKRVLCFVFALMLAIFSVGCKKEKTPKIANEHPPVTQEVQASVQIPVKEFEDSKEYTLMVYMIGSDLEARAGAGTSDLEEIENSGIDLSKADVYVYAGGTPHWHNEDADGQTNNVLRLTSDGFVSIDTPESVSMGEAETLTYFLDYIYNNTQSKEYSLIMWNHGSGPVMGYGMDIVYDEDALTLEEMRTALEASSFSNSNKLSFVGFDACLMASAELSYVWSDYADYLVASQEIEPAFGWNYDFLCDFGKCDTKSLVGKIVECYDSYCSEYYAKKGYENNDITLSCVDLSYADELEEAIDGLFRAASNEMPASYNSIVQKRVETRTYGKATTGSDYDLVDLGDMSRQLSELYPEETAVLDGVIDNLVLYNANHSENCCGVSIYYPFYNKYYFENGWNETYKGLGVFEAYQQFLGDYETQWLNKEPPEMGVMANIAPNDLGDGLYTLELSSEQNETYASAKYYIFEREGWGMYTAIYQSSDVTNNGGVLSANFDGNVIYAYNDKGTVFVPVIQENDTIGDYTHYSTRLVLSEYFNFAAELHDGLEETFGDLDEILLEDGTSEEAEESESETENVQQEEQEEDDGSDICYGIMHFTYNNRTKEFKVSSFVADDEESRDVLSRGKAQEIDVDEWHSYVFPGASHLYLIRNDDGSIKPISKWLDTGWLSHTEVAIDDGLYYEYLPLYDGNFFILFEVEDTSGNKYCSELLPVKNAEPYQAVEEQFSETQLYWSDGEKLNIFNEENVELSLFIQHDYGWSGEDDYMSYCFAAQNNGNNRVDVYVDDFVINDKIYVQDEGSYLYPKAGEYVEAYDNTFRQEIELGIYDEMNSLSFTVEMKDTVTGASVMMPKRYKVNISGSAKIHSSSTRYQHETFSEPHLGARAERQVIYDSDKVTVRLECFGEPEGWFSSDYGYISIENKTDSALVCSLEAAAFNDITVSYGGRLKIPAGCIIYDNIPLYELAEKGITEISKMDIAVSFWEHDFIGGFGELVWCPVVLSQKSDAEQEFTEHDKVVYDKNEIKISISDIEDRETTDGVCVSIINNSDKSITVKSINDYYDGVYTNYGVFKESEIIGPHQKTVYTKFVDPGDIQKAEFNLAIMDFSEEEIYYYEEDPITVFFE